MTEALRKKLATLPREPGVYFHKAQSGEVIYVGKAAVLRNRVKQYFQTKKDVDAKTMALVQEIYDTDWITTESEIDALFLESEMVKRYMPRYNVLLRDDKSQTFVRIDMKSAWPHVSFTRNPADDGASYHGPFYNGYSVKKALRYLRRVFPYYIKPPESRSSRLEEQIGLNPPQSWTSQEYKASLRKLIAYIEGHRVKLTQELEQQMTRAASERRYEDAAQLRNKLAYLRELQRKIMFGDREHLDISKDKALTDLASILGLTVPPRRIEGFDISHHGGSNVVASMVVFTNGVSDRSEYRKFKMISQRNDDTGAIYETIHRRFSERNVRAWGLPDMILVDGGMGQLDAACQALEVHALSIPIVGIAKREEELVVAKARSHVDETAIRRLMSDVQTGVFVRESARHFTINLHAGQLNSGAHSRNLRAMHVISPYDDVTKLFQRIRDESHRFAISYHTVLQRGTQKRSELDEIPGIGPATRRTLLRKFGSVRGIKSASLEELADIIGPARARTIVAHFSHR